MIVCVLENVVKLTSTASVTMHIAELIKIWGIILFAFFFTGKAEALHRQPV